MIVRRLCLSLTRSLDRCFVLHYSHTRRRAHSLLCHVNFHELAAARTALLAFTRSQSLGRVNNLRLRPEWRVVGFVCKRTYFLVSLFAQRICFLIVAVCARAYFLTSVNWGIVESWRKNFTSQCERSFFTATVHCQLTCRFGIWSFGIFTHVIWVFFYRNLVSSLRWHDVVNNNLGEWCFSLFHFIDTFFLIINKKERTLATLTDSLTTCGSITVVIEKLWCWFSANSIQKG